MVRSLCKVFDMVPVGANHTEKLLNSSLGVDHGEVGDSLHLLWVCNAAMWGNYMSQNFQAH